MNLILRVQKINDNAILPEYASPGDSGLDLFSVEEKVIPVGKSALVKTGIKIELPVGHEAQVRPRSGLALKNGITVLNTPGTIDEGYRGEIGVILMNHGDQPFSIRPGMKIAQMVICPVTTVNVASVSSLSETQRGEGGFGSTGV
jgi:dUTP pyrophosphatase